MRQLLNQWVTPQYGCPQGWLGRYVGYLMTVQHTPERRWTLDLLPLHPRSRVLEIGFGAGHAIASLAARVPDGHIAGVDLSATMVAVARRRNARWIRQRRVSLQRGTVTALPFADDSFDSAFSIHTVYFWPDIQQAFHELWRVLAPGGHLLITYTPGTLAPPATSLEATARERQMMADMEQAGFGQISHQSGPPSRRFATAAIIGIK